MTSLLRALDKPVLITEFNFGSADRGPFWGGDAVGQGRRPGAAYDLPQAGHGRAVDRRRALVPVPGPTGYRSPAGR